MKRTNLQKGDKKFTTFWEVERKLLGEIRKIRKKSCKKGSSLKWIHCEFKFVTLNQMRTYV